MYARLRHQNPPSGQHALAMLVGDEGGASNLLLLGEQLISRCRMQTAQALGFSPKRVFVLPTGMRSVNAMMVGPLPVGRLLCLTDGLLSTLDNSSLTGVLAHEVGHARMGHPGLLMLLAVVVPMMILSPLRLLEMDEADVTLQAVAIIGIMLLFWF